MKDIWKILLKKNCLEYFLILLMVVDMFLQVIPIVPFIFVLLLAQLVRLDINSNIFLFISYSSVFVGAALNTAGISGFGGLTILLGLGLLAFGIATGRTKIFKKSFLGFIFLAALLALFFISMITSVGGDFAFTKFSMTAKSGLLAWIAFVVLFSNIKRINTDLLGLYVIVYAFYLLRLAITTNTISGPSSLTDFAFLRYQSIETLGYIPTVFNIFYQLPGYYFLCGMGIILMRKHKRHSFEFIVFLLGFILTLYAGARQMIVTIAVLFIVWLFDTYKMKGVVVSAGFVVLLVLLYLSLSSITELFESTVDEGYVEGGGRGLWLLAGVSSFLDSPMIGVGFGRFNLLGNYETYPHNLIIEILAENGIVGLVVIAALTVMALYLTWKYLRCYFYLALVLLIMSMASGGMYDNIVLFSLVFASTTLKRYRIRKYGNQRVPAGRLAKSYR